MSRRRWWIASLLFLSTLLNYFDRQILSLVSPVLRVQFSLSASQYSHLFSAFLLGYALFQTPAGWLADRFGPRRVLTAGVVWWGVFSALTAGISHRISDVVVALMVLRFLLGAGEAIIYPASNQFVARWIPRCERGKANGFIFAGVGIGAGVTPPVISYLMFHYGWRSSFVVSALIGLAVGAVWFMAARDTPEAHPSVSSEELTIIQKGVVNEGAPESGGLLAWSLILSSRNVWILSLAYFCFGYVAWVFFSWFYLYLARVRGLDLKASALYATLPFLAMAVCSPLGGAIGDALTKRFGPRLGRCSVAVLGFVLAAIFIIFGSAAHDTRVASLVLAGGAGSLYLSQSAFWAVSADLGGKSSGSLSGFMNMANQIGGMITVSLTPFLADRFGWSAGFNAAAVAACLGGIAWLFVNPGLPMSRPAGAGVSAPHETA